MMIAVGHGLTVPDLRRSVTDLRALVTATLGQLILLPLIATVLVLVFNPAPAVIAMATAPQKVTRKVVILQ